MNMFPETVRGRSFKALLEEMLSVTSAGIYEHPDFSIDYVLALSRERELIGLILAHIIPGEEDNHLPRFTEFGKGEITGFEGVSYTSSHIARWHGLTCYFKFRESLAFFYHRS